MNKLAQSADTADADSDQEGDPEQLLDEWLGELDNLTGVSFANFQYCYNSNESLKPLH